MIVVVGLNAEARLAAGPGLLVLAGGGDGVRLARRLEEALAEAPASGVVSFGVAGGLAPGLAPGRLFVAREIVAPNGARLPADAAWSRALCAALGLDPLTSCVAFAGVDAAVCGPAGKEALHRATGAHLVDMESHIAARAAARAGAPFAALRASADPAERALPHAALVAMAPDGGLALGALAKSLARDPRQIAALIRTARDARAAFRALLRGRQSLVLGFGLPDFGKLVLDVTAEDEFGRPLPI